MLAPTNEKVMEYYKNWKEKSKTKMVHYAVLQATAFTIFHLMILKNSLQPYGIGQNLRAYINGFSKNMREVIDKFKLWGVIDKLEEKGLLSFDPEIRKC